MPTPKLQKRNPRFRFGKNHKSLRRRKWSYVNPLPDLVLAMLTQSDASLDVSFRDAAEDEGPEVTLP